MTMTAPARQSSALAVPPADRPQGERTFPSLRRLLPAAREQVGNLRRTFRSRFSPLPTRPERGILYPRGDEGPDGGWIFHDEDWVRVVHRFEHRRLLREGRALVVRDVPQALSSEVQCAADGSIRADVAAQRQQEWVWLHLDPSQNLWRDFRWNFTVRRQTDFRELQFGFRYVDFYNRYRFRHEDDHLHFDIVVNGVFWNSLHKVPFRMELGRDYRWRIEAQDNRFILSIDDRIMMDEVDRRRLFPRGSIAVIFWEDDAVTPIRVAITSQQAVEI